MNYGGAWGLSSDPSALITSSGDGLFNIRHNIGGQQSRTSGLDHGGMMGMLGTIPGWGMKPPAPAAVPAAPVNTMADALPGQGGAAFTSRTPTGPAVGVDPILGEANTNAPVAGPSYDDYVQGNLKKTQHQFNPAVIHG